MIKAKDCTMFAAYILLLLEDKELYQHYSQDALDLIKKHWDWDKRSNEIYQELTKKGGVK